MRRLAPPLALAAVLLAGAAGARELAKGPRAASARRELTPPGASEDQALWSEARDIHRACLAQALLNRRLLQRLEAGRHDLRLAAVGTAEAEAARADLAAAGRAALREGIRPRPRDPRTGCRPEAVALASALRAPPGTPGRAALPRARAAARQCRDAVDAWLAPLTTSTARLRTLLESADRILAAPPAPVEPAARSGDAPSRASGP